MYDRLSPAKLQEKADAALSDEGKAVTPKALAEALAPLLALQFRAGLAMRFIPAARFKRSPYKLVTDALLVLLAGSQPKRGEGTPPLQRARLALTQAALAATLAPDFNVNEWVFLHVVLSKSFGAWIHTHGLYLFRKPELEVFGVSSHRNEVLSEVVSYASYLAKGAVIGDGDTAGSEDGEFFVRFVAHDKADALAHFGTSVLEMAYVEHQGRELVTPISRAAAVAYHEHGVPPELIHDLVTGRQVRESERQPRMDSAKRVHVQTPQSLLASRRNSYEDESRAFAQGHVQLVDWWDDLVLARAPEEIRQIYTKELTDIRASFLRGGTAVRGVSVVIPQGGTATALIDALESFSRQAFVRYRPRDTQLVVVMDGPDAWRNAGERKGSMYTLLRQLPMELEWSVVCLREALGRATARNIGCHVANRDVVTFVDSSMVLPEHALTDHMVRHERLFGRFALLGFKENIRRSDFVANKAGVIGGSLKPNYRSDWKWSHILARGEGAFEWQGRTYVAGDAIKYLEVTHDLQQLDGVVTLGHRTLPTFFQTNLVSVALSAVKDVGGFDSRFDSLWGFEDSYLGALLYARGTLLVPCPSAVAFKIEHQEDTTKDFDVSRHRDLYKQLISTADMSSLTRQRFSDRIAALHAAKVVEIVGSN
jgi:hypothetical protein